MIGKIRKGRSFGGCIRYVTQKDDAEIIASEGVLLGTAEEMARSFRWQCLLNPDVANRWDTSRSASSRRTHRG